MFVVQSRISNNECVDIYANSLLSVDGCNDVSVVFHNVFDDW